jgi:hypothetical protein
MRSHQCQNCGERFECGVGSGSCWCSQVEVDVEALAELTDGGGDCLCPDCLPRSGSAPGEPASAA